MKITHLILGKPQKVVDIPDNSTVRQVCELLCDIRGLQPCRCGCKGHWFHNDRGQHVNVYVNRKPVTDIDEVILEGSSIAIPPPLWFD
jgi:hypothetical protein